MAKIISCGLVVVLTGCATAAPKPAAEPTETSLQSARTEPSNEAPMEEEAPPPPAGPVELTVGAEIGRTPVAAKIKIFGEGGSVIAEGNAGEMHMVQPGEYEVEATVTDAQALVDLPSKRTRITVAPGGEAKEIIEFARCKVRVQVNFRGKLDRSAVVTLMRNDKEVAKLTSGAEEFVSISPGRYSAKVKSNRAEITVSELILNEDATQTIPINAN